MPVSSYSFKSFFILGRANSTRQSVVPAGLVKRKKNVSSDCLTQGTTWAVGQKSFYAAHRFQLRGIFHFHVHLLTGISDPVRVGLHHKQRE